MSDRVEDCVCPPEASTSRSSPAARFNVGDYDYEYEDCLDAPEKQPERMCADASCQVDLLVDQLKPSWMGEGNTSSNGGKSENSQVSIADINMDKLQSDVCYCRQLTDAQLLALLRARKLKSSQLEKLLEDEIRAVHIRRLYIGSISADCKGVQDALTRVPFLNYDYKYVSNSCCENVIGYVPIPLGYAGPLLMNGRSYFVPLATTEGCLVASTNRGCRAIMESGGGVRSIVFDDGMSRGPVLRFSSAADAVDFKCWLDSANSFRVTKQTFDATSRFVQLQSIRAQPAGHYVYLRFVATTGDAMGMNMVSKATEAALHMFKREYGDTTNAFDVISLSGNFCVDKKPAAMNLIEGRGKSVVAETIITADVIRKVLHTDAQSLVEVNSSKHLGSALSGSIGGYNAHAANIVAALFIATGQDVAQTVGSSNCVTLLEPVWHHERDQCGSQSAPDLRISCTMNSLEVGTVGGGTILPAQRAALEMLGCAGASSTSTAGANACQLATIVCSTVLAAELSILAALTTGDLVKSHMKHNRSKLNLAAPAVSACVSDGGGASADSAPILAVTSSSSSSLRQSTSKAVKAYLDPSSCSHFI